MQESGVTGFFWWHSDCDLREAFSCESAEICCTTELSWFLHQIWPVKILLQSYPFMLSGLKNQVFLPSEVKKWSARHHFPWWCDAAVQIRFHGNRVKVARACSSLWWQKGRFQEWVGSKEWRTATDYQKQLPCSWILPNFLPNILLLFKTQHNSLFVYIDPLLLQRCETRLCALLKKQQATLFYFYSPKM